MGRSRPFDFGRRMPFLPMETTLHRTTVTTVPMIPTKPRIWASLRRMRLRSPDANYTTPDDGHHSPDDSYQTPELGQGWPDDGYGTPDANYTTPDTTVTTAPMIPTKPRIWAKARRTMVMARPMQTTPHRTMVTTVPMIPTKPRIWVQTDGTVAGCKLHHTGYHYTPDHGHHKSRFRIS